MKIQAAKEEGPIFNRQTKRWELPMPAGPLKKSDKEAFMPPNWGEAPSREVLNPAWVGEYKKFDEKWIFFWYICKGVRATSSEENITWHDWIEKENPSLYQKMIEEADEWFNVDLIAPAYTFIPIKTSEDDSIDKEWIRQTVLRGQAVMNLSDPAELKELREHIFNWMQLPEKDRWYD